VQFGHFCEYEKKWFYSRFCFWRAMAVKYYSNSGKNGRVLKLTNFWVIFSFLTFLAGIKFLIYSLPQNLEKYLLARWEYTVRPKGTFAAKIDFNSKK
jgi:hypothetical protein